MVLVLLWSLQAMALSHSEVVQTEVVSSRRQRREALHPCDGFKYSLLREFYGLWMSIVSWPSFLSINFPSLSEVCVFPSVPLFPSLCLQFQSFLSHLSHLMLVSLLQLNPCTLLFASKEGRPRLPCNMFKWRKVFSFHLQLWQGGFLILEEVAILKFVFFFTVSLCSNKKRDVARATQNPVGNDRGAWVW